MVGKIQVLYVYMGVINIGTLAVGQGIAEVGFPAIRRFQVIFKIPVS
jgi:hypothetical protein